MDANLVKAKLIEVLQSVQALSGETCPEIGGSTRPTEELPKFTSKVWPVLQECSGLHWENQSHARRTSSSTKPRTRRLR